METPVSAKPGWRFGVFEVDTRRGELRRSGVPIKLREQSFQILVALLEKPGEIVTRQDLRHLLWPSNTFVDFDHSLNTAMMKLRDALGDSTEAPIYIETIPKHGYRFIAPVSLATVESPGLAAAEEPSSLASGAHADAGAQHPISFIRPPARARPFPWRMGMVLAWVLLAVIGTASFWIWHSHATNQNKEYSGFKIVPVTTAPGISFAPSLSPDGREVAYVWDGPKRDRFEIYVLRIGTPLPRRVTYEGGRLGPPAWSPDGLEIAFTRCDLNNRSAVFVVPALGGPERRITDAACQYSFPSDLAWSSLDGGRLVFIDHCVAGGPSGLVSFSLATGKRQCLTDAGPPGFERRFAFSLSPDGKRIAFIPSMDAACDIQIISVTGDMPKRIFRENERCRSLMWTPDGQEIVFSSVRTTTDSLWRLRVPGGEIRKEPLYPAIGRFSADGRRLVYEEVTTKEPPSVWRADLAGPGGKVLAHRKVIGTQTSELDAQPSPDGSRLAWMSLRTGANEIWIGGANGENSRQLTKLNSYAGTPRWSPDGKWIVFDFYRGGAQIFVIDVEGRNLRQITSGNGVNVAPNWSRDGQWIYFASKRTGRMEVWKHSLESGKELQITKNGGFDPFESFDGQTVYFTKFDEAGLWSVPSQGGTESIVIEGKPQTLYWGYWALTRTGIYFLNVYAEPRARIEFYDFASQRSHPVLELEMLPAFAQPSLSSVADGTTIYYAQMDNQSVTKLLELSP